VRRWGVDTDDLVSTGVTLVAGRCTERGHILSFVVEDNIAGRVVEIDVTS
jgi:hypothetical protein